MDKNKVFNASSWVEEDRISSLPDDINTTFTPKIRRRFVVKKKLILVKKKFVVKIEQQEDEIVALKEQLNEKKVEVETMMSKQMLENQRSNMDRKEDRISSLSDDIIINRILSLCPLKYSIRTSVLSKRWAHLWALSPKLIIELDPYKCPPKPYKSFTRVSADTFTKSINKLFSLRNGLYIDTFKLDTAKLIPSHIFDLRPWIGAIVMCSVREMDIKIPYNDHSDFRELPKCLFTCKTVEVLKLSGRFILNVPDDVCLPNLKTLHLMLIVYPDDAMLPKLLSGCPVLEDLDIHRLEWDEMLILNVAISSLKRFTLYSISEEIYDGSYTHDQCRIVVDSPNLEFIDIRVGWLDDTLLKPLPGITEAHISTVTESLRDVSENKLIALLQSIVNVRRLYLSDDTPDYYFFLGEVDLPTFSNLVRLEISYQYPYGILMKMLRSSPNLETLCLPTMGSFDGVDIDDFDDDPEQVPECLCRSLKTVEIECLQGEEIELKIVKYFLGNAKVLEKMIICWDPDYEDEFVELETELRSYPRLSTDCQLEIYPAE